MGHSEKKGCRIKGEQQLDLPLLWNRYKCDIITYNYKINTILVQYLVLLAYNLDNILYL